jgi:replication factor A1
MARNKIYPSDYLAFLALKYEIDPDKLFTALITAAQKNKKQTIDGFTVELRNKTAGILSILIMQDTKVIAQFHLPEEFLKEQGNPIKTASKAAYMQERYLQRKLDQQQQQPMLIKDLKVGMKKVNLNATITDIDKPTYVITRFGNCATVANATITDPTGQIKLCLWNEQITTAKLGTNINIQNAHISQYKHEPQIRINKKGTITIQQQAPQPP